MEQLCRKEEMANITWNAEIDLCKIPSHSYGEWNQSSGAIAQAGMDMHQMASVKQYTFLFIEVFLGIFPISTKTLQNP